MVREDSRSHTRCEDSISPPTPTASHTDPLLRFTGDDAVWLELLRSSQSPRRGAFDLLGIATVPVTAAMCDNRRRSIHR